MEIPAPFGSGNQGPMSQEFVDALRNFGGKLAQTWPAKAAQDAYHAVQLPGQVASGQTVTQPTTPGMWSDEDEARQQATQGATVNKAAEMAHLLAGGGMPMAKAGSAGIFGGKLAATADQKALQEARKMDLHGFPRNEIWDDTGWFRGEGDNKWRFEIPDNRAAINPRLPPASKEVKASWTQAGGATDADVRRLPYGNIAIEAGDKPGTPLHQIMRHDDLYQAYPDMAHIPTTPYSGTAFKAGYYSPIKGLRNESILAAPATLPDLQSSMLHEMQHGVQNREGFMPGGNAQSFLPEGFKDLENTLFQRHGNVKNFLSSLGVDPNVASNAAFAHKLGEPLLANEHDALQKLMGSGKFEDFLKHITAVAKARDINDTANKSYFNLPGEKEAYNVQARAPMDALERIINPPWSSTGSSSGDNTGLMLRALRNKR